MAWFASPRRRVVATTVAGGATLALIVLLVGGPEGPTGPTPEPRASASPTAVPARMPLAGATDDHPLPPCDASVRPEPVAASPAAEAVRGRVFLELVGHIGGGANAAILDRKRLLTNDGSRVVAIDLADPERPRVVATSEPMTEAVSALAVADDLAVAGLGDGGLAVLRLGGGDIELAGALPLPGYVEAVALRDSLAFVADGPGGLRIVDLRDPAQPVEVGAAFDLHRIMDVAVAADTAYLAAADEGLLVVDIGSPSAPTPMGGLLTGGYAHGVAVDGSVAYLADGWGGLAVTDVGAPTSPRLMATVPTVAWVTDVAVSDGLAYMAAGLDGLRVIGVSDPGQPEDVASIPFARAVALGLTVTGDLAAIIDGARQAVVVDLREPEMPHVVSTFAPLGSALGLAVADGRAFLAAKDQGLRVIDIADPQQPRAADSIPTADWVTTVTAVGSNLVFSTIPRPGGSSLHSLFGMDLRTDSLEPGLPVANGNIVGTASSGSMVLMGIEGGLEIIDASTGAPCELGYLQTFDDGRAEAAGVAVMGRYAYLAVEETGIHVIDFADPRAPELVGNAPLPANFKGIHATYAAGSFLFAVGTSHAGQEVLMFDLAVPTGPRFIGSVLLPVATLANAEDGVQPLAYSDGHLFVADGGAGLLVVDVSDPPNLAIAGQIRLPGRAASVVTADGRAYIASLDGGLSIVEWESSAASASAEAGARTVAARPADAAVATLRLGGVRECTVTTAGDGGPGSLRDCLEGIASSGNVRFDPAAFPPGQSTSIRLESPLPPLPDGVTVSAERAGVVLDGGEAVEIGLLAADETMIRGLAITRFTTAGVWIDGGGNTVIGNVISANGGAGLVIQGDANRVVGNLIGPDRSGAASLGFQEIGIDLHGRDNHIGGPEPSDRNIIGGSRTEIWVKETWGNTIEGNYIGTDATGQVVLRPADWNRTMYFEFRAGGNRVVGNVIAGGIIAGADPGSWYNAFVGNLVGLDPTGLRELPCECSGFVVTGQNRVGGTRAGEGNVGGSLDITGWGVIALGNRFGQDAAGRPLGDTSVSIFLHDARRNVVGGRAPSAANLVGTGGIRLTDASQLNLLIGNGVGLAGGGVEVGVEVGFTDRNQLVANRIQGTAIGVTLSQHASDNRLWGNAFQGNDLAAIDEGRDNRWDDGVFGNFWSDHIGPDADGNGIIDLARDVPSAGMDRFPRVAPP